MKNNSPFIYRLRWIAVLPGASLCAVLILFPLHWVLYGTLSSWVEPYPELPERVLTGFAVAWGFVVGGAYIAPSNKLTTAIVLFSVYLTLFVGFGILVVTNSSINGATFYFQYYGVAPLLSLVGAIVGLITVKSKQKDWESEVGE